jgi:hypothetical protein
MENDLPKFDLNLYETKWLKKIYAHLKEGEIVSYRYLKAELIDEIPINFDHSKIDHRLVRWGNQITLLGIWNIDPKSPYLKKADKMIRSIKELLLTNPDVHKLKTKEVAKKSNLSVNEVLIILDLVEDLGKFWSSSKSEEEFGIDNKVFDEYLKYSDLESLILESYNEFEAKKSNSKDKNISNKKDDVFINDINPIF